MRSRGLVSIWTLTVLTAVGSWGVTGCASSQKLPPDVIQAGQVDIQLPPGWRVEHGAAVAVGSGTGAVAAGATTTTIPLQKENPTTAFFQAASVFSSCLKGLGVTFIGTPDPSKPQSPTNDPNYLKALETCAAQSNILQALKAFQTAQNDLTPAQIRQENQAYLKWRTCMIGRGWTIPTPTPDSEGRLFSINVSSSNSQIIPPPGQSILNSPDVQACAQQAQLGKVGG